MSTEDRFDGYAILPALLGGAFAIALGAAVIGPALHDADLSDRRSAELAAVAKRLEPSTSRARELATLAERLRSERPSDRANAGSPSSSLERWSGDFATLWNTVAQREARGRLRGVQLERVGDRVVLEIEADRTHGAITR